MYLYPYKNGSQGAKDLSDALGIKQIKREGSKFKGNENKLIINWGSSDMNPEVSKCKVLNKPEAVAVASNKLSFFNAIKSNNDRAVSRDSLVSIPEFFTSYRKALEYYNAGYTLVCRTILNGHSGAGIVLADPTIPDAIALPNCSLYVMYQPKKSEYRVHVLNGDVVDVQKKMRRLETPDDEINWKIRNHDNGFIYARDNVVENIPKNVLTNSIRAVKVCGLDFGAVDVIYNERRKVAYVLEINTAPGLSGETLDGYAKRFKELEQVNAKAKNSVTTGIKSAYFDPAMMHAIANAAFH